MKSLLFSLSILLCGALSLQAQEYDNLPLENTVYKITPEGDSLLLDIFLPDSRDLDQPMPVVMIIHGGAWIAGDKMLETIYYMRKLREQLTQNGFAVVSIDYTLVDSTTHFPAPIADCKDAIRWVRAHAATYNFDPDNIGLWGGSAGGHLALLAAYTTDQEWPGDPLLTGIPADVAYVVDNFGPTDLNSLLQTDASKFKLFFAKLFMRKLLPLRNRLILALTGYAIDTDKPAAIDAATLYSPLEYVDSGEVPTLILHGTKDRIVPLKQSKKLQQLLNEKDIENELIIVKRGNHGFTNISQAETDVLVAKTVAFILEQQRAIRYR